MNILHAPRRCALDLRQMNGGSQERVVDWTEDRIAILRALWSEGKSSGQIANCLGHPATRNAVIGKLDRIGLLGSRRVTGDRQPNQYSWHRATAPRTFSWEPHA